MKTDFSRKQLFHHFLRKITTAAAAPHLLEMLKFVHFLFSISLILSLTALESGSFINSSKTMDK